VKWQYKTILFEFRKDGLLGDRYIDDEDTENVLNEQGGQGWELVSVTPVQEGLLSFFKRALPQQGKQEETRPGAALAQPVSKGTPQGRPVIRQAPAEKQAEAGSGRKSGTEGPPPDMIGEIKIR